MYNAKIEFGGDMGAVLNWSELNAAQKIMLKYVCETDFMAFHRSFFAMSQNMKWNTNWHHKYIGHYI